MFDDEFVRGMKRVIVCLATIAALLLGVNAALSAEYTLALASDWRDAGDGCNKCVDLGGGVSICTSMWCGAPGKVLPAAVGSTRCERCVARCQREVCPPVPSPEPTRSPKPCRQVGARWDYTFQIGEEVTFCFDSGTIGGVLEVQSQNHGNASCAQLWMQAYGPTGSASTPSQGVQPGAPMQREKGRYYVSTKLYEAAPDVCRSYTFTWR